MKEYGILLREVTGTEFVGINRAPPENPGVRYLVDRETEYAWDGDMWVPTRFGATKAALWMPPGNATTAPGVFGTAAATATGTATARTVATTNIVTRQIRVGYVSAASAGSLAGIRVAAAQYTTGQASSLLGGFLLRIRFNPSDAAPVSGARGFVGMQALTTAPTNVNPATGITNCIGVAQIDGTTNLCIVANNGTTSITPVNLGSGFPADSVSSAYELTLVAHSSGGCRWRVAKLNSNDSAGGWLSPSEIPAATTLLCLNSWRCNNATALAVGIDFTSFAIEQDY